MRNPSFLQLKRGLELPFQLIRTSSSHTGTLPRFPVPILGKTLDRYLKSAKPFLSSEERCKSEDIIKKFGEPGGVGDKLQEKLLERAQKCDNWLEEWWVNVAYLEYRDPVVVFSNPGLVFPPRKFNNLEEQLDTAAKLTVAALNYKKLIDDGEIPLETSGKSPLDMDQYHKVFGTIRQPWKPRDKLLFHPKSEHIVVAYKKNFFKIRVIQSGQIVKSSEILAALKKIVTDGNEGPGVGILTSDSRDNWSETYAALKKDPVNANSIKEIEESIFLLCLDGDVPSGHQTITDAIAANLVHGGSSQHNSSNRWFDKTIQFVVGSRTGWGLNYEHSPAEGQAIARLMDHIVEQMECDLDSGTCLNQEPIKLSFSLTDELRCAVERASENLSKITNDLEFNCIKFSDFGKNAIKKLRVSPDSFIQMAMQYAFYRVHQTPAAHYETGSTRMFKGGRTETIRSCSEESVAFARAMLNNRVPDLFKAKALLAAINAHKEYTVMAMSAQGVDRHFLGLRKIAAQENQTEGLEIFEDVAWKRSTHMRISSSQVAGKSEGFMIYGPLVHDGYACCYNPRDDDILFGTSAWRSNSETKLLCFGQTLQEALREMRQLLENNPLAKL